MTFHYTDPDGDHLVITPTRRYGRPAISLRSVRDNGKGSAAIHIYADQVEELVTGIRDTARQAATERAQP
jgi:hypothetical protein